MYQKIQILNLPLNPPIATNSDFEQKMFYFSQLANEHFQVVRKEKTGHQLPQTPTTCRCSQ